jgi:hypothetical protein
VINNLLTCILSSVADPIGRFPESRCVSSAAGNTESEQGSNSGRVGSTQTTAPAEGSSRNPDTLRGSHSAEKDSRKGTEDNSEDEGESAPPPGPPPSPPPRTQGAEMKEIVHCIDVTLSVSVDTNYGDDEEHFLRAITKVKVCPFLYVPCEVACVLDHLYSFILSPTQGMIRVIKRWPTIRRWKLTSLWRQEAASRSKLTIPPDQLDYWPATRIICILSTCTYTVQLQRGSSLTLGQVFHWAMASPGRD